MSRVVSLLVAFLVYLMVPGSGELTEQAVHWVQHGDGAHADTAGYDEGPADDEHGCSGTYHLCLCCHHGTSVTPLLARAQLVRPPSIELAPPAWRHDLPSSISLSDIFRPPIA